MLRIEGTIRLLGMPEPGDLVTNLVPVVAEVSAILQVLHERPLESVGLVLVLSPTAQTISRFSILPIRIEMCILYIYIY